MTDDLTLLTEAITELTRPRTHREPFTVLNGKTRVTAGHVTEVPSLVAQLEAAVTPGGNGDSGMRSAFGSRPSARVDAIDTLMRIDTEARNWLGQMRARTRNDTSENLQAFLGAATTLDTRQLKDARKDACGWATCARVVTGWEVAPFRPHNTCPLCSQRGGLRVRVGDGIASGMCTNCGENWDQHTIGLLADHIRYENQEGEATA